MSGSADAVSVDTAASSQPTAPSRLLHPRLSGRDAALAKSISAQICEGIAPAVAAFDREAQAVLSAQELLERRIDNLSCLLASFPAADGVDVAAYAEKLNRSKARIVRVQSKLARIQQRFEAAEREVEQRRAMRR
jgi:hypothetical protein